LDALREPHLLGRAEQGVAPDLGEELLERARGELLRLVGRLRPRDGALHARRCGSIASSICCPVTLPSRRATTRLPLTSTSVGTVATRKRSAMSRQTSTFTMRRRSRLRSRTYSHETRPSIRRDGPDVGE